MYLLPQLKKDTGQEAIFNFIKKGKIDESDIFKAYDGLIYTSSENKKVKTQELHLLRNNIMDLAKLSIKAKDLLESDQYPQGSKNCDTCQYLKKRWDVNN